MEKIFRVSVLIILLSLQIYSLFAQSVTNEDAKRAFNKATTFDGASQNDSALIYYLKTLSIDIELYGEKSPTVAMLYGVIGDFFSKIGNYEKALNYHRNSLKINKELFGEKHQSVENSFAGIGFVNITNGELDSALVYFHKALNINTELLGKENNSSAFYYNIIGTLYFLIHKYDSAIEYHLKCVKINQNNPNANPLDVAKSLESIGDIYFLRGEYISAIKYLEEANNILNDKLGNSNISVAKVCNSIGECYLLKDDISNALKYFQLTDNIIQINPNNHSPELQNLNIDLSINMGRYYNKVFNNRKALESFQKALSVIIKSYGEGHLKAGTVYGEMGRYYFNNGDYSLAENMLQKGLSIYRENVGENHSDLAWIYTNLGNIYFKFNEYDLALEYYRKANSINILYFSDNSPSTAIDYMNIGNCYRELDDRKLALDFYNKAYFTSLKCIDDNPSAFATILQNIGNAFLYINEYNWALKYFQDAIIIYKQIYGDNSPQVALIYNNTGYVNYKLGNYKSSADFYQKASKIYSITYGKKHPELARAYNNIGTVYYTQGNNKEALNYYQLGITSNLSDYSDKINSDSNPKVKNYFSSIVFQNSLWGKAQVYNKLNNYHASLINYQLLDTLIGQMRRHSLKMNDKFLMGVTSNEVYQNAIKLCLEMTLKQTSEFNNKNLFEEAFYFSERNKAGLLLEALAGQESLKFAGIPDSLLRLENELKSEISFVEKEIAELPDSLNEIKDRNQLFKINRQYDELIARFEKEYPDYYNLKYSTQNPTLQEIQDLLDDKTAIRSYFSGDSSLFIFTLTNKALNVSQVPIIKNLNDSITWFRYGLTKTSPRMQENFRRLGYKLYQQLFPESTPIDNNIENLIVIPDGILATIPFESLLTSNFTGNINEYKEYPYLIKKYNISYSYSANLFYCTFSKQESPSIEITKLNDWLAFAPVFDNSGDETMILSTRELQKQLNWLKTDSLMTNRSMFDRSYITPLPATEKETEAIFKLYDENNLKAKVLLHNNANEKFLKSGELEQYKVLHFATHGFVNSDRPELSGLLLAQDTTSSEDGVLYSGEIYNLKINSDLVVLSACETGLGKIQKGEGIIGLTRALLYAGAKNIIVSLWQVADESTSDLMVDFYKNSLENKGKLSYSDALKNAKLKMISEGKYAHPLFWSPFILIGK